MPRTALLIRCATDDADRIRIEARRQDRTINSYVLHALMRTVEMDDRLEGKANFQELRQGVSTSRVSGPRSAIIVRCDELEAKRIRDGAKRRALRLNTFVIQSLKTLWQV
jgi:predicted HicB family RNase H-like nuclease